MSEKRFLEDLDNNQKSIELATERKALKALLDTEIPKDE